MSQSKFVYVTYIRTTQEKLWEALVTPAFNKQFWFGTWQDSAWTEGASWKLTFEDGRIADEGEVLHIDPPNRLVLKWRHALRPELTAEGYSQATFVLEPAEETVKLTVTHEIPVPESKLIEAVSNGWPTILSSLKSLLETGTSFKRTQQAK